MGYEIDFLAVGEKSKGGDAISLRWGDLYSNDRNKQFIVIIDSGLGKDDEGNDDTKLVDAIDKYYGTNIIDLVVSTHPDADHIKGLSYVLNELEVKKLWLHLPWNHDSDIASKFKSDGETDACKAARELFEKAQSKGTLVEEPFSCNESMTTLSHGGQLRILGPSKEYYEKLLPEFDDSTKPIDLSPMATSARIVERIISGVQEFWGKDSIKDNGKTTARNNSSVILELSYDTSDGKHRLVFTADAGIPALEQAVNRTGPRNQLKFIQIPHHGSERNVGPTVLNYLVGDIVPRNEKKSIAAFVSCPKENPENKHPNKRVLNAFTRRGCNCFTTAGMSLRQPHGAPNRDGWDKVSPCEFYEKVEDDS